MKRILFFGDSLTAGYGLNDPSVESFPALIQQKINAEKLPYEGVNAGLSGDTSAGGLNRLNYWLAGKVDVFILELGANDIMRGVPPPVTFKNLEMILSKVRAKYPEAKLVLMGMEIPEVISGAMAAEFRGIFRKLADTYHMAFVPFFLDGVIGQPHLNLMDGFHPSAMGYQVIADKTWKVIRTML